MSGFVKVSGLLLARLVARMTGKQKVAIVQEVNSDTGTTLDQTNKLSWFVQVRHWAGALSWSNSVND
jgi:hypothetical protein